MGRSLHKKAMKIGPGGMNCPCCGPKPGIARLKARRRSRSIQNHQGRLVIKKELEDLINEEVPT